MKEYCYLPMLIDDPILKLESIEGRNYIGLLTLSSCKNLDEEARCLDMQELIQLRDAINQLLADQP